MKLFGCKGIFAIEYILTNSNFGEKGILGESWGQLRLWVNGNDICEYERNEEKHLYEYNLIYIIEWFHENLKYILNNDPITLPVAGQNSLEIYKNSGEYDTEDDEEFNRWFEIRQEWYSRHNWFWNGSGSFLPDVFFRKVIDNIEIAWDNKETHRESMIEFVNPYGICYIPQNEFQAVMCNFLTHIIDELLCKLPNETKLIEMKTALSA